MDRIPVAADDDDAIHQEVSESSAEDNPGDESKGVERVYKVRSLRYYIDQSAFLLACVFLRACSKS